MNKRITGNISEWSIHTALSLLLLANIVGNFIEQIEFLLKIGNDFIHLKFDNAVNKCSISFQWMGLVTLFLLVKHDIKSDSTKK